MFGIRALTVAYYLNMGHKKSIFRKNPVFGYLNFGSYQFTKSFPGNSGRSDAPNSDVSNAEDQLYQQT